jgi:hypothetical protein
MCLYVVFHMLSRDFHFIYGNSASFVVPPVSSSIFYLVSVAIFMLSIIQAELSLYSVLKLRPIHGTLPRTTDCLEN